MIELKIQIASLLFSYIYGIFISFFSGINYNISKKKILKIIFTILITIIYILIYFILLRYINEGYMHPYFILMIILGYTSETFFMKKLFVKMKRK